MMQMLMLLLVISLVIVAIEFACVRASARTGMPPQATTEQKKPEETPKAEAEVLPPVPMPPVELTPNRKERRKLRAIERRKR